MDKLPNSQKTIFFSNSLHGLCLCTLMLVFVLSITTTTYAQGMPSSASGTDDSSDSSFKFMPIPYINYDRSIGFSIGALPMAMYK